MFMNGTLKIKETFKCQGFKPGPHASPSVLQLITWHCTMIAFILCVFFQDNNVRIYFSFIYDMVSHG